MNIKENIEKVRYAVDYAGAKAMLAAANAAGRAMTTKPGKAALIVPMAVYACTMTAQAAGEGDAQAMIDGIMGALKPGVVGLGSLVAVVGGIQTGVGFKDDNPDGKTRGFMTLIGGGIIAAVGGLIPDSISIGSGN